MMESNFYSDDFERLIREKTEQYKMYPSEKVWKGVHGSLHTKKRWYIAGMSVLVTGIILVAGKELILPSAHTGPLRKQPLTASLTPPKSTPENTTLPAPFTEFKGFSHAISGHADAPAPNDVSMISIVDPAATDGQPSELNNMDGQTSDITAMVISGAAGSAMTAKGSSPVRSDLPASSGFRAGNHIANVSGTRPADTYISYLARVRTGNGLAVEEDPYTGQLVIMTAFRPGNIPVPGLQIPLHTSITNRSRSLMQAAELVQPISADDDDDEAEMPDATTGTNNTQQKVNWLQDYAVYSMHPSSRKNTGYWQIYFAPTLNVRGLSGGTPMVSKSGSGVPPMSVPQASPASAKAPLNPLRDMGFEGGGSLLYKISPTLSVKAGLQFNYSKFALNSYPIAGPAPGPAGFNPNSIAAPDSGSTAGAAQGGQATGFLHNEYYQLSAPVGLELRVWGNDRLQVNIAATVQPTYLLGTTAWLLMADEAGNDSYIKAPSLFRKWNIDGGAEAYISYKIGSLRLQAGPEFRYQFLSSYSNQYPVRENLNEYGLKIGIMKAIR